MIEPKPLSERQLERLSHTPDEELCQAFPGRPRSWLRDQKRALKNSDTDRLKAAADLELRRERYDRKILQAKYEALMAETDRLKSELEAATILSSHQGASLAIPRPKANKREATAVALASDWHAEEPVDPDKVSGLNEYSVEIFKRRSGWFFRNLKSLIAKESEHVNIPRLVLWLGGDFFTGNIHEDTSEANELGLMDAAMLVQDSIVSGIKFLVGETDLEIVVPCSSGNHGRITKERRIKTEQENSLERYMYSNISKEFASEPRVKMILPEGYHTYLDLYGMTLRFHHGHSISYGGGVGGITIPVNKSIASWNIAKRADLDCFGHFHQRIHSKLFVSNGSMIGYNEYAVSIKAPYEEPTQAFFLIDSKHGKTTEAPILLCEP